MDLLANLALGFDVALTPTNVLYCFIGVTVGTFIGVLPGVGAMTTVSILLPLTFGLDPVTALIMLAGIYYGALYGGSTASILVNLPGTPASAVVCIDGYPMAQQGRAAPALVITTIASFVGASISLFVIALISPLLADFAMTFRAPDYFSMMVVGLLAAASVANKSKLKSVGMILLGIMIGLVGIDRNSGVIRYNFGIHELMDGIGFIVVAMGIFGIAEVLNNVGSIRDRGTMLHSVKWRQLLPTREDLRATWRPILRGTGIGSVLGALPGTGSTLASFMAYSVEKKVADKPERFGRGAIEGVAAPEAANNSASQTAFIPTLTLGIPGDAMMALMLGALVIHGITPGPNVIYEHAPLFWGLVASMWIGNLLLLLLNLPLIGMWVRMLRIPYRALFPTIVVLICIGVFASGNQTFDVMVVAFFGLVGYLLIRFGCEPAPLLLGLILGPMMEQYLRRSMILSRGDPAIFVQSPISAVFLAIAALMLLYMIRDAFRTRQGIPGTAE